MTTLYGKLELFCEQGMEGNALPMFQDASKMHMNKFGVVEGGYDCLVRIESGMHLTIYNEERIYEWSMEAFEENGVTHPRLFEGELDLVDRYEDRSWPAYPENTWAIRIIHDSSFDPEVKHLWTNRAAVAYKPGGIREIAWAPSQPCHNVSATYYKQDNPIATFYTDLEQYKQEVLLSNEGFLHRDLTPEERAELVEERYNWERDFSYHPAHYTWNWMFESGFCAKLET